MNIDRRSFMIGIAAVTAVSPAIVEAAIQPYASGGYIDGNALATLWINGERSGAALACNVFAETEGQHVIWRLDRALDFACEHNGTGVVRFTSKWDTRMWCQVPIDTPITVGCNVRVAEPPTAAELAEREKERAERDRIALFDEDVS